MTKLDMQLVRYMSGRFTEKEWAQQRVIATASGVPLGQPKAIISEEQAAAEDAPQEVAT